MHVNNYDDCQATKPALIQNRFCIKTGFASSIEATKLDLSQNVPALNLPHQNRLCIGTKPVFSFLTNISTISEVRCDCQGLGLVARIEASILVFETIQVLYWPALGQIQFCSFDRRCNTCLDTKPVLYQGRFCSLTDDHRLTRIGLFMKQQLSIPHRKVYFIVEDVY